MLKFIRNVLICALAVCVALVGFIGIGQMIPNQSGNSYCASLNDKYEKLLNRSEPHIIIIGGSNVAFGLDTKAISEALGMPALNMGLHAGLKRDFPLNVAKSNIMEGDIIILAFEYSAYIEDLMTEETAWSVIDNHPEFMKMIPKDNVFNLIRYYPLFLAKKTLYALFSPNPEASDIYNYRNFDEYGDLKCERIGNLRTPEEVKSNAYIEITPKNISDESMQSIKEFAEFCRSKGAEVYASSPSVDEYGVKSIDGDGASFEEYYEEHTGVEMISSVKDFVMPTEYFYDTHYHLNDAGVQYRTKMLIRDMKKVIK